MAFGVSSFYILSTNDIVNLISIDPFQNTQWNNYGIKLLKELNLYDRHKLLLKKSHIGLPLLFNKYGPKSFDFIFIDGWHTFDYTLLDFYYSDKLLKINGIIIIDDALHKGVNKCTRFINNNYKDKPSERNKSNSSHSSSLNNTPYNYKNSCHSSPANSRRKFISNNKDDINLRETLCNTLPQKKRKWIVYKSS